MLSTNFLFNINKSLPSINDFIPIDETLEEMPKKTKGLKYLPKKYNKPWLVAIPWKYEDHPERFMKTESNFTASFTFSELNHIIPTLSNQNKNIEKNKISFLFKFKSRSLKTEILNIFKPYFICYISGQSDFGFYIGGNLHQQVEEIINEVIWDKVTKELQLITDNTLENFTVSFYDDFENLFWDWEDNIPKKRRWFVNGFGSRTGFDNEYVWELNRKIRQIIKMREKEEDDININKI